jgi:MSHA biogenesis protein MshQ
LVAAISDPDGGALIAVPAQTNSTKIRNGRLRLQNGYGSDRLDLPLALTAQYWNGSVFTNHVADNCTSLAVPTASAGMVFGTSGNLSAGKTTASINGVSSGTASLLMGDGGFVLSRPGSGNTGYVDVTVSAPVWLQYAWSGSTATNPTARAVFGMFKSPLIYRRENY